MEHRQTQPSAPALPVVGWREWTYVPRLLEIPVKAKIDTGATTSTIHAANLVVAHDDSGQAFASFELHPNEKSNEVVRVADHPVIAFRFVRSSSGHGSYRPVIRTLLTVGNRSFSADITLAAREQMGFRMLLGRAALRGRFQVDPSSSFLQGEPS